MSAMNRIVLRLAVAAVWLLAAIGIFWHEYANGPLVNLRVFGLSVAWVPMILMIYNLFGAGIAFMTNSPKKSADRDPWQSRRRREPKEPINPDFQFTDPPTDTKP